MKDIKDLRLEALTAIKDHEIECEKRYGEIRSDIIEQRAILVHLRRVVWYVLGGMLTTLIPTLWQVLGS